MIDVLNKDLPIPSYDEMIVNDSKEELGLKVGIIDADLLSNNAHRFPNLALMKISAYYKRKNYKVSLVMDYHDLFSTYIELPEDEEPNFNFIMYDDTINKKHIRYYKEEDIIFDKIFIGKVFTDSQIPFQIKHLPNTVYGGTGFFYDKAPDLPEFVEHMKPDYILYHTWIGNMMRSGRKRKEFEYYLDYSIGFMTRGCFRKCEFCVNKKYDKVQLHSPVEEFLDTDHKYICLLDDNLFGYPQWKSIIEELVVTKKSFQFKQGLDLRLMTDEKAKIMSGVKYKGDYIFAFDNLKDRELIEAKLTLWRKYNTKTTKLYVLVAYDNQGIDDVVTMFERVKILMKYKCLPYIMRYKDYKDSDFYGTYVNVAAWCNQPAQFKKRSYREWCLADLARKTTDTCSTTRYMYDLELKYPEVAKMYYDLKYSDSKTQKEFISPPYEDIMSII